MPRAGLNPDAVTALAVELTDSSPEPLSLAAVAARAGVAVPSLYKHVRSLGELRGRVALIAVRELTSVAATATAGVSGPEALRALGHGIRSFAREHPGLYAATQVAPATDDVELTAAAADLVAIVVAVVRELGLPEGRAVDAVRTVRAAVHGFVELERSGGFGLPDDVDRSFAAMLDVLLVGLSGL